MHEDTMKIVSSYKALAKPALDQHGVMEQHALRAAVNHSDQRLLPILLLHRKRANSSSSDHATRCTYLLQERTQWHTRRDSLIKYYCSLASAMPQGCTQGFLFSL